MFRTMIIASLAICIALSALAGTAEAKGRGRAKSLNGTFNGSITRLGQTQMSFQKGGDRGMTYTVNYDQKTAVTGGRKQGTLDDLAVGQEVKITVKNNRADKIDVVVK